MMRRDAQARREAGPRAVLPPAALQGRGVRDRADLHGAQRLQLCRGALPVRCGLTDLF